MAFFETTRKGLAEVKVFDRQVTHCLHLLRTEAHEIQMQETPLGSGGCRVAFLLWFTGKVGQTFVAKQYLRQEAFLADYQCATLAAQVATAFNSRNPPRRVQCIVPNKVLNFEGQLYWIEDYLPGQWDKHNNIFGMVLTEDATAQAFSHFSYEHSGRRFICLDVQGVGPTEHHAEIYTDVAIVTHTLGTMGYTDTGIECVKTFFNTHVCNDVCRQLGLAPLNGDMVGMHVVSPGELFAEPSHAPALQPVKVPKNPPPVLDRLTVNWVPLPAADSLNEVQDNSLLLDSVTEAHTPSPGPPQQTPRAITSSPDVPPTSRLDTSTPPPPATTVTPRPRVARDPVPSSPWPTPPIAAVPRPQADLFHDIPVYSPIMAPPSPPDGPAAIPEAPPVSSRSDVPPPMDHRVAPVATPVPLERPESLCDGAPSTPSPCMSHEDESDASSPTADVDPHPPSRSHPPTESTEPEQPAAKGSARAPVNDSISRPPSAQGGAKPPAAKLTAKKRDEMRIQRLYRGVPTDLPTAAAAKARDSRRAAPQRLRSPSIECDSNRHVFADRGRRPPDRPSAVRLEAPTPPPRCPSTPPTASTPFDPNPSQLPTQLTLPCASLVVRTLTLTLIVHPPAWQALGFPSLC